MTAQGSAATRFKRAIERRSLLNAEIAAREMGRVSLEDALALVVLYMIDRNLVGVDRSMDGNESAVRERRSEQSLDSAAEGNLLVGQPDGLELDGMVVVRFWIPR